MRRGIAAQQRSAAFAFSSAPRSADVEVFEEVVPPDECTGATVRGQANPSRASPLPYPEPGRSGFGCSPEWSLATTGRSPG